MPTLPRSERLRAPALHGAWLDVAIAGVLAATTLVLAVPAFGTSTLWRDDAWTALTIKTDSVSEFLLVAVNAPGFSALLKGWLAVVGFDEWKAQLLPLTFAVATPPLLYIVLVRRGLVRVAAASGGFLLAVSPEFLTHATRVKQYTLDAFVVVCLLGLSWWLLDDVTSARRWRLLALGGGIALVLSSPSVVYLAVGLGTGLLALLREDRLRLRVALAPIAAAGVFVALWYLFVLRPAVASALTLFWQGWFIPLDEGLKQALIGGIVAADRFLEGTISLENVEVLALLFAAAYLVALARRPFVGLLLLGPLAIAFVLAMLELAPIGTGRTDSYLYPAPLAAVALAVDALARRARLATAVAALAGAVALLILAPTPTYRLDDVSPLVAEVEARASPQDAIVTYPLAGYQYALYTSQTVDFRRTDATATGFRVGVRRKSGFVLTEAWPRDTLLFAAAIADLGRTHDSVWVVVPAPNDRAVLPPASRGATKFQQFRHRWEAFALPFGLRAIRRAYGLESVPPELRDLTIQEYVGRVMHEAGYRRTEPALVRTGASLSHWRR